MVRHEGAQSGHDPSRRRRRRLGVALGSAVLLVTGLLQPLGLIGSAHADDNITGPLLDAINLNAKNVSDSIAAAEAASAALAANAEAFSNTVATIAEGAPNDPQGALTALQGAATGEVTSLAGIGLAQALTLASRVSTPTCSTIGALTATLPDVGTLSPSVFGPLAGVVTNLDKGISDALLTYYTNAFTKLLTPLTLPPAAGAVQPYVTLAQTLLSLLKMNWHTTYTPPGGGTPVVRDTPGFLGLPTLIDVDGHTGEDICALMNLNLTSGAMTQSIARVPFTGTLPLDISGQFLNNLIVAGYETHASKAPASFNTTTTASFNPVDSTIFKAGTTFDQVATLAGLATYRLSSTTPATSYHFATSTPGGSGGSGTQYNYTAGGHADRFAYSATLLGFAAGSIAQAPAATSFEYCTSAKGFCSNEAASDSSSEKGSMHLLANQVVTVDVPGTSTTALTCPLTATGAHLTGSKLYVGQDSTLSNSNGGHIWVDTANLPVNGCLRATAGITGTFPSGFKASARKGTWKGTGIPPALTKTGQVVCPSGTTAKFGTTANSFAVDPYFCFLPPVSVVPTVAGDPYQGSQLTATPGTWSPDVPNAPAFTYQWQRCDGTGNLCVNIAGANALTYTITAGDRTANGGNSTLRFAIRGTNADGSVSALSLPTPKITLPPLPVIVVPPVISGTANVNQTLHATTGTWKNGTTGFAYQWQRCAADGTGCVNIPGATNADYLTTADDRSHSLVVVVTASNITGPGLPAPSAGFFVRPAPINTTLPVIKNGAVPSAGLPVFQGDTLSTVNNTTNWQYADSFAYQWLRCDSSNTCTPINNATAATYKVVADDIGNTIAVQVKGINPDPTSPTTVLAAATGTVLANALLPRDPGTVPDGPIYSSAPSNHDTTYVGGDFDTVGPRVGGAGAIGAGSAALANRTATLKALVSGGSVKAMASDGSGGYFLGGNFTSVKGTACNAVAHIQSDDTLDSTYCRSASFTGEVRAFDYVKKNLNVGGSAQPFDVLWVGGLFTNNGHQNLMALDNTGLASYPSGEPNGAVNTITDDTASTNFFYGGAFTALGSTPAKRMGAVTITAAQTAGTPLALTSSVYPGGVDCVSGGCTTPVVNSMAVVYTSILFPEILFGGTFDVAYGANGTPVNRHNVAAIGEVAAGSQIVGQWNPNPNGTVITSVAGISSTGIASAYLAGDFTSLSNGATTVTGFKGVAEYGIASIATSGLNPRPDNQANPVGTLVTSSPNTAWQPQIDNGSVLAMIPVSTPAAEAGIYLAGSFTSINGTVRHRLAEISLPNAAAPTIAAWDPNAGQTVRAIARFKPSGNATIFAGGDYLVLGGDTRNNVAELTKTGTFTTWAPAGTNGPVRALASAAGIVYAGGDFSKSGTANRANLAAFDAGTAATTSWNPGADGKVYALTVSGGTVYVGGAFATVGGVAHNLLAAVGTDATVRGWDPKAKGTVVRAIAVDGGTAYVGGEFTQIGTDNRANLAAIDTTSGNATTWNPGTDGPVYAVALNSVTVYVGGTFATVHGVGRSNAAGIARADGSVTDWNPQADDTVRTLAVLGSKVFAGGDFSTIGGASKPFAAALFDDTGLATDGFSPAPNGRVYSISVSAANGIGLFGSFTTVNNPAVATNSYAFYGG